MFFSKNNITAVRSVVQLILKVENRVISSTPVQQMGGLAALRLDLSKCTPEQKIALLKNLERNRRMNGFASVSSLSPDSEA